MNLVEWNPFRELDYLSKDLGTFWERSPFRHLYGGVSPKIDVYQTAGEIIIKADLPGVSREDLNIYVDENSIRLSGQMRKDAEFKDEEIYRSERYYGAFSRSIPLPVEIEPEKARAEYRDGILTVTAPRAKPAQIKGKKLEIQ
ncbi:MAG: Hsp20/alpha crystallin family protein [Peptococcaceae bacterium]|jgi:HSP20 family protein|nr:Hsp20/alpha crystallin family protein [Peptococcaceae bacterium]MDH7524701.1 Hsp20/alpha crystallin family protein [Peptococcaceae bacterium]